MTMSTVVCYSTVLALLPLASSHSNILERIVLDPVVEGVEGALVVFHPLHVDFEVFSNIFLKVDKGGNVAVFTFFISGISIGNDSSISLT